MYLGLLPYWKKKGCSIPKVAFCNKFKQFTLACGGAGNLISKKIFYNKNYFSASVQDGPKNELESVVDVKTGPFFSTKTIV